MQIRHLALEPNVGIGKAAYFAGNPSAGHSKMDPGARESDPRQHLAGEPPQPIRIRGLRAGEPPCDVSDVPPLGEGTRRESHFGLGRKDRLDWTTSVDPRQDFGFVV